MFEGFKVLSVGQGAGQLFIAHPGPHELPWLSLPRQRRCLCLSHPCSEGRGLIFFVGLATTHSRLVCGLPVLAGPLHHGQGACSPGDERHLHIQAPGWGVRVLGEPQPVPNACPHEASTNRTPFFVVI